MVSPGADIPPHSYHNENKSLDFGGHITTVFAAECV